MPSVRQLLQRVQSRGVGWAVSRAYEAAAMGAVRMLTRPLRTRGSDPYHEVFARFVREANALPDYDLLELGSRYRVGEHGFSGYRRHVGLDVNAGPNVDVVGDIHKLSKLFGEEFDVVYSISVFEHLAMPWKAVLEINRVMRPGGLLYISTHPCWPPHALPWDFYRFQQASFSGLLNKATGFEIMVCQEGLPGRIVSLAPDQSTRGLAREKAYLGVAVIARKIGNPAPGLSWDVEVEEFLETQYPESGHSYL